MRSTRLRSSITASSNSLELSSEGRFCTNSTWPNPCLDMMRLIKSTRRTMSTLFSPAPASRRESSRRSTTVRSKRLTWDCKISIASLLRSENSALFETNTSTAAPRAVTGERSSWLTSLAKRCSRSMRCCTASAISLKDVTSLSRSGSFSTSRRVSSPPVAISSAAPVTRSSGRKTLRLVVDPRNAAATVIKMTPISSVV